MQLDRVAIRIDDQDLPTTGTGLDFVEKSGTSGAQAFDDGRKLVDVDQDAIPATWLLPAAVR